MDKLQVNIRYAALRKSITRVILLNSTLYMYFELLLKYNARVARRALQLTRRMSSTPDLTLAEGITRPI
jgi:hypothetical protein